MSTPRRVVLNSQSRELVVKLHHYFERESQNNGPLVPVTRVVERVSQALGISTKTVSRIIAEKYGPSGTEDNELKTPNKRKRTKPVTGIDKCDADAIRSHVYGYFERGEYPSAKKLLVSLTDAGLYKGSAKSLRVILKKIGFQYKKIKKQQIEQLTP